MEVRKIGVVTVGRSDYGIYRPLLRRLADDPHFELRLFVSGAHLAPEFGGSLEAIEADGFPIAERIDTLLSSDHPQGTSKSIGLGVIGFADALTRSPPDILVLLGDRFDMFAAAIAALPFRIPIAHLHGGESTEGLIDESIRHAITKMSHLHFVSTDTYGRRVVQMGEDPRRVTVAGATGIDALREATPMSTAELAQVLGFEVTAETLLVTYHPVTLQAAGVEQPLRALMGALKKFGAPVLITFPNADPEARAALSYLRDFCATHPKARIVPNLGTRAYVAAMTTCAAMVGNSSSGIIEAATFELPVVDIGRRQQGRLRPRNVRHAEEREDAILAALREVTPKSFRASLRGLNNPYGDGRAAARITKRLREVPLDESLLIKRFHDRAAN